MSELSITPREKASKSHSLVLRKFTPVGTATSLALALGTNDKRISEFKNNQLEDFCIILAHLGLKIVEDDAVCVSQESLAVAGRVLQRVFNENQDVFWGAE